MLAKRSDDLPVSLAQYLVAHVHVARCWRDKCCAELEWFVQSMRGELPKPRKPIQNFVVHHVHLPYKQYLMALEALTTRLGVKLT